MADMAATDVEDIADGASVRLMPSLDGAMDGAVVLTATPVVDTTTVKLFDLFNPQQFAFIAQKNIKPPRHN